MITNFYHDLINSRKIGTQQLERVNFIILSLHLHLYM